MKRYGIFGGSFDPVHVGHVYVARHAAEYLKLDALWVVPTSANPLKSEPTAAAAHRLWFAEYLAAQVPGARVDAGELAESGPAFTVRTLRRLTAREKARWILVLGGDAFARFAEWQAPEAVLDMADVAVFRRGSQAPPDIASVLQRLETARQICYDQPQYADEWHVSLLSAARTRDRATVCLLPGQPPDVSSTDLRRRIRQRQTLAGLVPDEVNAYIRRHALYQDAPGAADAR